MYTPMYREAKAPSKFWKTPISFCKFYAFIHLATQIFFIFLILGPLQAIFYGSILGLTTETSVYWPIVVNIDDILKKLHTMPI